MSSSPRPAKPGRAARQMRLGMLLAVVAGAFLPPLSAVVPEGNSLPAPLQKVDPHILSPGLYLSLVVDGHFGGIQASPIAAKLVTPPKGQPPPYEPDARVGTNVSLGSEGTYQTLDAHLAGSLGNLIATASFLGPDNSLSIGWNFTFGDETGWQRWSRVGGTASRSTGAVVDRDGTYLAYLESAQPSFSDGGAVKIIWPVINLLYHGTQPAPTTVTSGDSTHCLDRVDIAVNHVSSLYPGEVLVTYTSIDASGACDLYSTYSMDGTATWSSPVLLKPHDDLVSTGAQPCFLPDRSVFIPYVTGYGNGTFTIAGVSSHTAGVTYDPSTVVVPHVMEWVDPVVRNNSLGLVTAVARTSGALFIAYAAKDPAGQPCIFVVHSGDSGATWSDPVVASDNPPGDSVMNPAIAVTADGQSVTIAYYDQRRSLPGADPVIDVYSNTSYDGGATWAPGFRLTAVSSDYRLSPRTGEGYLFGDTQGLRAPDHPDQPAISVAVDTRRGYPELSQSYYAFSSTPSFAGWWVAHLGIDRDSYGNTTPSVQPLMGSGHGLSYAAEYYHAIPAADIVPAAMAVDGSLFATHVSDGALMVSFRHRAPDSSIYVRWTKSTDGLSWSPAEPQLVSDVPSGGDGFTATLRFPLSTQSPIRFREEFSTTSDFAQLTSLDQLTANGDARLVNLSARGQVETGENQLIAGFVTSGGPKSILVRCVGPTLATQGVTTPVLDPQLTLVAPNRPAFVAVTNNDWSQGTATAALFARLGAQPLPVGSADAAFVQTLGPGPYSALASDTLGLGGIGLVEIYDADPTPGAPTGPYLVNLSARGEVGTGDNILIGGFVIVGTTPKRILVRAVGPTIADMGVAHPLADPILVVTPIVPSTLHFSIQSANDDWERSLNAAALAETARRIGAFALHDHSTDAALLLTLSPGIYTAAISQGSGGSGVALVEIYDAD